MSEIQKERLTKISVSPSGFVPIFMEYFEEEMRSKASPIKSHLGNLNSQLVMMLLTFSSVLVLVVFTLCNNQSEVKMTIPEIDKIDGYIEKDDGIENSHQQHLKQNSYSHEKPLLTLFTTFKRKRDRWRIHWNVLRNWSLFHPKVNIVLFDDRTDKSLIFYAKQHHWTVLQVPAKNVYGTPKLKDMFKKCQNSFPSSVYFGYANGDILFDEGLTETLEVLSMYLGQLNQSLIIGMRTNINIKGRRILTLKEVRNLARAEGKLFRTDAEDYFLLAYNSFPWQYVPDIVIGRPAYDNFLVATAHKYGVAVIDATKTLIALHQTGKDGDFAGHKNRDAKYNTRVIGPFNFSNGLTLTAEYATKYDQFGKVKLWQKPAYGNNALLLTPSVRATSPVNARKMTSVENTTPSFHSNLNSSDINTKLIHNYTASSMHIPNQSSFVNKSNNFSLKFTNIISTAQQYKNYESNNIQFTNSIHNVTLFTIFDYNPSLSSLHLNTIKNWAQFVPYINPVLFSNGEDKILEKTAKSHNWTILPKFKQLGSVPPIKKMFVKVQETFPKSVYVGYVKGNLLFTWDLIKTLSAVSINFTDLDNILVLGMKCKTTVQKNEMLFKSNDVSIKVHSDDTMLHSEYDENFIISHHTFPWQHIPELVIGRSVYNNFIVALALRREFPVIDATKTMSALEQVSDDPRLIFNELEDFDPNLLGTLDYSKGFSSFAQFETGFDTNGSINITRRHKS